ncbi:MAG: carbohydrate-binding domain-containing protein [Lachnospiraceae bacterium]|nr:carbohydrate-binding domain-containing protein [Lachnospiraceae bacterium]
MRKKILTIGLAAMMMLSLAGCGKGSNSGETKTTASSAETETDVNSTGSGTVISDDDMFSDRDYDISYDDAEDITLADGASKSDADGVTIDGDVITVTKAGSYRLTGSLSNGQIIVECDENDKVQLVLDGVDITCENSAVIYVKSADKVFITTTDSENNLTVSGEFAEDEDGADAVIFAKDDITLNGAGTLNISCENSHGIVGKDDVKITSGTYNIEAAKKGIDANDSVRVADGIINITSGTDGIHVENADDETLGFFYAIGGEFNIEAGYDGIDASGDTYIYDGEYNITAGGGYENGAFHSDNMMGGGFGGQMPEGMTPPDMQGGEMPDGMTPPDMQGGEMPDGMTPPDMQEGQMPEGFEEGQGGRMGKGGPIEEDGSNTEITDNQSEAADENKESDVNKNDAEETEYDADDYLENSTKGIKADGGLYIYGGSLDIDAADDTLHSDNEVIIDGGEIILSSGDDGIHADVLLTINGGSVEISNSYEALEAHTMEINGGNINLTASDDGLNAGGSTDASLTINGGIINISAAGDCVDSNGTLAVTGGETYVSGPNNGGNGSIDYEINGYITGGTFVSAGASGMAMNFGSDSTQCSILYELSSSVESGTPITLSDSDGNIIVSYTPDKAYQSIVISSPDIESDGTYTLTVGSNTYTIEMSGYLYGQGTGMGGFGQGPQGR